MLKLMGFSGDNDLSSLNKFINLEKLTLAGPVSDKSLNTLKSFKHLKKLEIFSSDLTDKAREDIKKHYGKSLQELNIY